MLLALLPLAQSPACSCLATFSNKQAGQSVLGVKCSSTPSAFCPGYLFKDATGWKQAGGRAKFKWEGQEWLCFLLLSLGKEVAQWSCFVHSPGREVTTTESLRPPAVSFSSTVSRITCISGVDRRGGALLLQSSPHSHLASETRIRAHSEIAGLTMAHSVHSLSVHCFFWPSASSSCFNPSHGWPSPGYYGHLTVPSALETLGNSGLPLDFAI